MNSRDRVPMDFNANPTTMKQLTMDRGSNFDIFLPKHLTYNKRSCYISTLYEISGSVAQLVEQRPFKSLPQNCKSLLKLALIDSPPLCLATCLAILLQEHPDFVHVADAWPELPQEIRQTILNSVSTFMEDRTDEQASVP